MIRDEIFLVIMNTAASEHEAVHAHSQMLTLGLEALPHKHAGSCQIISNEFMQSTPNTLFMEFLIIHFDKIFWKIIVIIL